MKRRVLICTRPDDFDAPDDVAAAVLARGCEPLLFHLSRFPASASLSVTSTSVGDSSVLSWDGHRVVLEDLRSIWLRRFARPAPVPGVAHALQATIASEATATITGLLYALDQRHGGSVRVINSHDAVLAVEGKKLTSQRAAHIAGLQTLPSTITNDVAVVRRLRERCGPLVAKMQAQFEVAGKVVMTNAIDDDAISDGMPGLELCPMLFQPLVQKVADVRAVVVGDRVFAAQLARGDDHHDWRRHAQQRLLQWEACTLPEATAAALVRACRALRLDTASADFVVDGEGNYVFLEINPAGEYLWLERVCGHRIAEAIADLLCAESA